MLELNSVRSGYDTANIINTNFQEVENAFNSELFHLDGSKAMLGPVNMNGYDIDNVNEITFANGLSPFVNSVLSVGTSQPVPDYDKMVWHNPSTGRTQYFSGTSWYSQAGETALTTSFDNSTSGLSSTNVKAALLEIEAMFDNIDFSYDNTTSGLAATTYQAAIDELDATIDGLAAAGISYDNTLSGLTATNVKGAIDELKTLVGGTSGSAADAVDVAYDNSASGLAATEVQSAITELDGRTDTLESDVTALQNDTGGGVETGQIVVHPTAMALQANYLVLDGSAKLKASYPNISSYFPENSGWSEDFSVTSLSGLEQMDVHPDGDRVAAILFNGTDYSLVVITMSTGDVVSYPGDLINIDASGNMINSVEWSPSGSYLLVQYYDDSSFEDKLVVVDSTDYLATNPPETMPTDTYSANWAPTDAYIICTGGALTLFDRVAWTTTATTVVSGSEPIDAYYEGVGRYSNVNGDYALVGVQGSDGSVVLAVLSTGVQEITYLDVTTTVGSGNNILQPQGVDADDKALFISAGSVYPVDASLATVASWTLQTSSVLTDSVGVYDISSDGTVFFSDSSALQVAEPDASYLYTVNSVKEDSTYGVSADRVIGIGPANLIGYDASAGQLTEKSYIENTDEFVLPSSTGLPTGLEYRIKYE